MATLLPVAWDVSRVHEIGDALRHHLLPHLPLRDLINLGNASRDWHHLLIDSTSPSTSQLSPQAHQALLPSGLTSSLSFQQVLQRQGQLLGRLRGHSLTGASATTETPQLQILKATDSVAISSQAFTDGCEQPDDTHAADVAVAQPITSISWSPQASLEETGCQILFFSKRYNMLQMAPLVFNVDTEAVVTFQQALKPEPHVHLRGSEAVEACAQVYHWLSGGNRLLLASDDHAQDDAALSSIQLCNADSCTVASPCLRGLFQHGCGSVKAIASVSSIFFCAANAVDSSHHEASLDASEGFDSDMADQQVLAFSLDSRQAFTHSSIIDPIYAISCPSSCLDKSAMVHCVEGLAVAPNEKILAIRWNSPSMSTVGISIHEVPSGAVLSASLLNDAGSSWGTQHSPLQWASCSSYLLSTSSDGAVIAISTEGLILWRTCRADRSSDPLLILTSSSDPALISKSHATATQLVHETSGNVSPCGRYIFVADHVVKAPPQSSFFVNRPCVVDPNIGLGTILDAASGDIVHQFSASRSMGQVTWSASGNVCLLPEHGVVFLAHPFTRAAPLIFQELRLAGATMPIGVDWSYSYLSFAGCELSLSPSGSMVVGLTAADIDGAVDVQLQQWQLPKSTWLEKGSSTLQPTRLSGPVLHEPSIAHLAWHPHENACLYAVGNRQGGLHVVNGQASRFLYSWTKAELGSPDPSVLTTPCKSSCCLAWSHDGHGLAASLNGINAVVRF